MLLLQSRKVAILRATYSAVHLLGYFLCLLEAACPCAAGKNKIKMSGCGHVAINGRRQ